MKIDLTKTSDMEVCPSKKLPGVVRRYLEFKDNVESISPNTRVAYLNDLHQAVTRLRDRPQEIGLLQALESLEELKTLPGLDDTLLRWAQESQRSWGRLSQASKNRKTATLKSFFRWLQDVLKLDRDLASLIFSPQVPQRMPFFVSVDEVLAIVHSLSQTEKSPIEKRKEILFYLLYGCGLRVSEACALKWSDLDFASSRLKVLGKAQIERIAVGPKEVLQKIYKLKEGLEGTHVFGSMALNRRTAYRWIRALGVQAGLQRPLHPHALRHSFATHLLSSGSNLRNLQELLGHRTLAATQKYTHLDLENLHKALELNHPLGSVRK